MTKHIRLFTILERLSKHHKVCVKELAVLYEVDVKTIQNDFKVIREYFTGNLIKKADCYYLLSSDIFSSLFSRNPQLIKRFLRLVSMVDSVLYGSFISKNSELLEKFGYANTPIYQIENSPYEKLKSHSIKLLETLEEAIVKRTYLTITHHKPNEEIYVFKECQVLKLLYLEDNWYIALNTLATPHTQKQNSFFRLMRISFIEKISLSITEPKTFHSDNIEKIKAENSLNLLQTPFSKIHNEPYRVIVEISAFATVYFRAKRYLKTQREIKKLENGATLFEFTLTDDMEIILLIQQWIPHLKVIEPLRIKKKIEKSMREFMKGV